MGASVGRTKYEELKFLEKEREEFLFGKDRYDEEYPTRVNRMKELRVAIEEDALRWDLKEWNKEVKKLPEWKRLQELKKELSAAERYYSDAMDEYDQVVREPECIRCEADVDQYMEEVVLPAVDKLPFGKEYRTATKRLEEIRYNPVIFVHEVNYGTRY